MTTVVHVRDVLDRLKAGDPEVVYIGRGNRWYGLKRSRFANPFTVSENGREGCIALFRAFASHPGYAVSYGLVELRGKTLACWCKPDACHGDVLAELADVA